MKYVGFVFSSIWRLWFFIVFLIVFIILIPPLYFFTRIIPNQKTVCNITRLWSRLTLLFSGVFLNVKYEKEIDEYTAELLNKLGMSYIHHEKKGE